MINNPSALCFGEILFDVFGDDRCIGGAPFNFAAHFAQLGGEAVMVSAVGDDELGKEAIEYTRRYGISDAFVSTAHGVPTATVRVTLKDGSPSYEFGKDVSYDHIRVPAIKKTYNMLYFGTLAQRADDSETALDALLCSRAGEENFFDVNIRKTGCGAERISELLEYTTILKFSREEASALGGGDLDALCRSLADAHRNIKLIIVTLDRDGSFVYDTKAREFHFSRRPRSTVVSTVSAGDGYSARFMYDYLRGRPIDECIENATKLAERICGQKGAI